MTRHFHQVIVVQRNKTLVVDISPPVLLTKTGTYIFQLRIYARDVRRGAPVPLPNMTTCTWWCHEICKISPKSSRCEKKQHFCAQKSPDAAGMLCYPICILSSCTLTDINRETKDYCIDIIMHSLMHASRKQVGYDMLVKHAGLSMLPPVCLRARPRFRQPVRGVSVIGTSVRQPTILYPGTYI